MHVVEYNCEDSSKEKRMAYPFSSVESDWEDGAELKCLIDPSDKHSACPCKVAALVTYFTKLLACKWAGKRNT